MRSVLFSTVLMARNLSSVCLINLPRFHQRQTGLVWNLRKSMWSPCSRHHLSPLRNSLPSPCSPQWEDTSAHLWAERCFKSHVLIWGWECSPQSSVCQRTTWGGWFSPCTMLVWVLRLVRKLWPTEPSPCPRLGLLKSTPVSRDYQVTSLSSVSFLCQTLSLSSSLLFLFFKVPSPILP